MLLPDESTEPVDVTLSPEAIAAATAPAAPAAADAPTGDRIGRFSVADLQAMRGKRGRKPPEFYLLFPKTDGEDAAPAPARAASGRPRRTGTARVSSAVLGDHTIDELLAMIGTNGRKPVAYDILRQVAETFVERGAITVPIGDPLAAAVAEAKPALRELIAELVRQSRS